MIEIAPKETERLLTWNDAKMYCFSLTIDGKTGWRLPTMHELEEIYQSENDFTEWNKWYYWSSTEYDASYSWVLSFKDSNWYRFGRDNGLFHTRAVRDLT